MQRSDANAIAFRAVRSILSAAHPVSVPLGEGREARVEVAPLPDRDWPENGLEGLDAERDGAWPPGVELLYTWPGGTARLTAQLDWWRTTDASRHFVGIGLRWSGGEAVWVTFALPLRSTPDGEEATLTATLGFMRRKEVESEDDWRRTRQRLREQARLAGLPRPSPGTVELCRVRAPSGEVLPSPEAAFERLARVGLLKLVVLGRGDAMTVEGAPPFDPDGSAVPLPPVPPPELAKRAGLAPLPGGVRSYVDSLAELLRIIEEEGLRREDMLGRLAESWNVTGSTASTFYAQIPISLGLAVDGPAGFELTEAGAAWLANPTGVALFPHLHAAYEGILLLLALIHERGALDREGARDLGPLMGAEWKSDNQVSFRRNWLLSMGLTERERGEDRLTPAGLEVIEAHRDEVNALLPSIRAPQAHPGPSVEPVEDEGLAEAELLDLRPELVRAHLGTFRPPPRVIEQCCAALSSGRHLLLVGPPGTGKTELAGILAEAARSEDYCAGLLTTTASADWTTFDTIGGYALRQDGRLSFRPGVFPTALSRGCWLLVDELNRADVDKAFGELMTVLSGKGTLTPYLDQDGQPVRIGPEPEASYRVPPTFRVIATMNTWDKTSLFRLSSALQRRFAVIHVGLPAPTDYANLLEQEAQRHPALDPRLARVIIELFGPQGISKFRPIGPAVPLDILRYLRFRKDEPRGSFALAEGLAASLLSQLEGLDLQVARAVRGLLMQRLDGVAAPEALHELGARLDEVLSLDSAR